MYISLGQSLLAICEQGHLGYCTVDTGARKY